MNTHRARAALAILRGERDDTNSNGVAIHTEEADQYRPRIRGIAGKACASLAGAFPYEALERILNDAFKTDGYPAEKRETVSDQITDSLRETLHDLLESWSNSQELKRKEIEDSLLKAFLAGVAAAFAKWCARNGLAMRLNKEALARLETWARPWILVLVKDAYAGVCRIVQDLIDRSVRGHDSPQQTSKILQEYLDGEEFENAVTSHLADTDVTAAFHKGAWQLNVLAEATHKLWVAVEDGVTCGVCNENAAKGVQPIDFEYDEKEGLLTPPEHQWCRCGMVYYGVTSSKLDTLSESA